jgi:hypothetical protein
MYIQHRGYYGVIIGIPFVIFCLAIGNIMAIVESTSNVTCGSNEVICVIDKA